MIISLYLGRDPDNSWVEADDRLGPMVQARSDLAAGDLRLLYLGWLLGAQWAGEDDEDVVADTEPPVPAGLGDLSVSLRAIADFLEIDKDLMAVAAETKPSPRRIRERWTGRMDHRALGGGEGHAADHGRRRRRCPGTGPAAAALPRK